MRLHLKVRDSTRLSEALHRLLSAGSNGYTETKSSPSTPPRWSSERPLPRPRLRSRGQGRGPQSFEATSYLWCHVVKSRWSGKPKHSHQYVHLFLDTSMGRWMDGEMDGWLAGWMDGWADGWIDGWINDEPLGGRVGGWAGGWVGG